MQSPKSFLHFSDRHKQVITWLPVIGFAIYLLSWFHPFTQKVTLWALKENHPVELLTFVVLLCGGILGFYYTYCLKRKEGEIWPVYFYAAFSGALIFVALEEISWGQQLLHFNTPAAWKEINMQDEVTLHNLRGLQGRSEILHLTYAISGLFGIWLGTKSLFKKVGVPSILLGWFVIIIIVSSIDVYNDFFPIDEVFDRRMQRTSELMELFIGTTGLLYIALNFDRAAHSETD